MELLHVVVVALVVTVVGILVALIVALVVAVVALVVLVALIVPLVAMAKVLAVSLVPLITDLVVALVTVLVSIEVVDMVGVGVLAPVIRADDEGVVGGLGNLWRLRVAWWLGVVPTITKGWVDWQHWFLMWRLSWPLCRWLGDTDQLGLCCHIVPFGCLCLCNY